MYSKWVNDSNNKKRKINEININKINVNYDIKNRKMLSIQIIALLSFDKKEYQNM